MRAKHVLLLIGTFVVGGCAPRAYVDGVIWQIQKSGVTNAAFQGVSRYPGLRVDAFLIDELEYVTSDTDLEAARDHLTMTLGESRRLGEYAVSNEIDRLSASDLAWLWRQYFSDEDWPYEIREEIRDRFASEADSAFAELSKQVQDAESLEELHALAVSIRDDVTRSPKDRHGGGALLAWITASVKEDRGPLDRGGLVVDVYEPGAQLGPYCLVRSTGDAGDDELLRKYSPIIVQERNPNATYRDNVDRVGTVRATRRDGEVLVAIDTTTPSVYAYARRTWVNGRRHLQLTYTLWFPEHPELEERDAEAGPVEGATLRITLDTENRPALFETVRNCGCYHRCYPSMRVEASSCEQFGSPLPSKRFCIEKEVEGTMDWIVPETVVVEGQDSVRPILFSRAGWHGVAGVSFDLDEIRKRNVVARRDYDLRCYEELERLPGDGEFVSMFGPDGLVHGAGRLEGWYLAPTGMLSAGQPRQRGTQLLHWDQYDFDDPHLLERCLRLPADF